MKLVDIIYEIGDTQDEYDWDLVERGSDLYFSFSTDNFEYGVEVSTLGNFIDISFGVVDESDERVRYDVYTDEGNQFKVVSTVVGIAEEVWKNRGKLFDNSEDLQGFATDSIDKRKLKLYKTFIKNRFSNAKIEWKNNENLLIKLSRK